MKMKLKEFAAVLYSRSNVVVTSVNDLGNYFEGDSIELRHKSELQEREIDMVIVRADRVAIYVK